MITKKTKGKKKKKSKQNLFERIHPVKGVKQIWFYD